MSIQELIEKYINRCDRIQERMGVLFNGDPEKERLRIKLEAFEICIHDLQSLQSEHKAEIEAAYEAAFIEGVHVSNDDMPPLNYKSAEDYYQKTFTPEKFKK